MEERKRRRRRTIADILIENTYGGSKGGVPATRRQMPVISKYGHIKMEWDRYAKDYPSEITVEMTDGEWVRYQIYIEQPAPPKRA